MTRHLTELEIAASLVPGAHRPRCPIAGCTACAARLDEAHAAERTFAERVLPKTLPQLRARLARRGWFDRIRAARWPAALVFAAATAVVAVALWPREPYVGAKGSPSVDVFVRHAGAVHALVDGGQVMPGDAIRFRVDPRGARYVLVVSIDGAGKVSVYYPFDGATAEPLPDSPLPVELDGSVVLDGVLGDERLWVLLSDAPIAVAEVRPVLDRLAGAGPASVLAAGSDALTTGLPGVRALTVQLHKVAGQ